MDYKEFSKNELIEILETIQTLINCRNEADIKMVLEKAKELVCGDYSILYAVWGHIMIMDSLRQKR